jgi:hypothetical protein
MILIYKCLNCNMVREVSTLRTADEIVTSLDNPHDRNWMLHPCGTGVTGIAQLVAVLE